ncbi:formyltransferase family protein [Lachnospiraceae bacterium 45-W7]
MSDNGLKNENYIYQRAVVLGTGTLALSCASVLEQDYHVLCEIYDTGEEASKTFERQAKGKGLNYQWISRKELSVCLADIREPALLISAINPWIIPGKVLQNQNLLAVNCHQALLPEHPGRNAEMWAIYEQDKKTGITWHIIRPQVDGGEILIQKEIPITKKDTSFQIFRKQINLAQEAFLEILEQLLKGTVKGMPQTGEQPQIRYSWETPEEGRLNTGWPFEKISAFLRALDYGGLEIVKKPYIEKDGKSIFWKHYKILEEPQEEEKVCFDKGEIRILRKEGKILLKGIYE